MHMNDITLPLCKASLLEAHSPDQDWLIQSVWARTAIGIIGGAPKCCKSWFGLDMAVSVASSTPCLDTFPVIRPGPVLAYLAEDAFSSVRSRIAALCAHRNIDFNTLNLYVITASSLRLDLGEDQKRLENTIADIKPRLVVLDPLVRLHRLDENSASDISRLLGYIRVLQRSFDTAIALVHHASKKHRPQPGQSLRGSSDLHAFGDSNAYLARRQDNITLTLEHRAAKPPDPLEMQLLSNSNGTKIHLKISSPHKQELEAPLTKKILDLLKRKNDPITRTAMRNTLKVNNLRLGNALIDLQSQGLIVRSAKGWLRGNAQTGAGANQHRSTTVEHLSSSEQRQYRLPF